MGGGALEYILDKLYPVGIIVEFSKEVDPNICFAPQKWIEYGAGQTTVGQNSGTFSTLGGSVGSETVTLTTAQIPSHNHSFSLSTNSTGGHTHDRGDMNITGTFALSTSGAGFEDSNSGTGAFYRTNTSTGRSWDQAKDYTSYYMGFEASRTWTGFTSENGSHTHTISGSINNTGSGGPHTNIQPSVVVKRYTRIS